MTRTRIALSLIWLCVSLPAVARTRPTAAVDPGSDLRLKQLVTLPAMAASLDQVAGRVSKLTGVEVKVGSGPIDWRSREHRVVIALNRAPLGAALEQIGAGLGFEVQRTGHGPAWSYRLLQTKRGRIDEAAQLKAQIAHRLNVRAAKIAGIIKDARAARAMDPAKALALGAKDPWRAYLGGTKRGRAVASVLTNLPSDAVSNTKRGDPFFLWMADASPAFRSSLEALVMEENGPGPRRSVGDISTKFRQSRFEINPIDDMVGADTPWSALSGAGSGVFGQLHVVAPYDKPPGSKTPAPMGLGLASEELIGPDTPSARWSGRSALAAERRRAGKGEEEPFDRGQASVEPTPFSITVSRKPSDPRLLNEIGPLRYDKAGRRVTAIVPGQIDATTPERFRPLEDGWYLVNGSFSMTAGRIVLDIVRCLTQASMLSVIVDFNPEVDKYIPRLPAARGPIYKLLDSLGANGIDWSSTRPGFVRMKPREWALYRSYDLPQSFLEARRQTIRETGSLEFDDLATVAAALSDEQINTRFLPGLALNGSNVDISLTMDGAAIPVLRICGRLSAAAKAEMRSAKGLDIQRLSPRNRAYLEELTAAILSRNAVRLRSGRLFLDLRGDEETDPADPSATRRSGSGGKPVRRSAQSAQFRFTVHRSHSKTPVQYSTTLGIAGPDTYPRPGRGF